MENSVLAVLGAAILVWLVSAAFERGVGSNTYFQALGISLLKFIFGVRLAGFQRDAEWRGPLLFVLLAQSRLDRLLLRCFLPAGTFHVSNQGDAAPHAMVLLKSVMAGRGIACVYLPPQVEPTGATMQLLGEVGQLAREAGARVVPVFVRGSRFSLWSLWPVEAAPRSLLPQITIQAGADVSLTATDSLHIADQLFDGMADAKFRSLDLEHGLVETLVAAAKQYGPNREILEDALGGKLTYRKMLIGIRALATRIEPRSRRGEAVGLLLPNSNAAVIALFATISAGRVAAMLNYTAGTAAILGAITTANMSMVICSRGFEEKADLGGLVAAIRAHGTKVIYIEDMRTEIKPMAKLSALLLWRRPLVKVQATEPAVVLFTSGSEGTPKGVVLSSLNLIANAGQADCRVDFSSADTLLNVLPIFHSFGLLGGTLLPLLYGIALFQYPSPLHYRLIPGVARKLKPTIMFGTDTFLHGYGRAAKEGDFESLRLIVAGAEAVRAETRRMFRDRFGAEIVEGYGMTEASPVVAVNSITFSKDGSVGRLLTGMEMRLEPVEGIEDGGRFFVAGPNVMLGYLLADKPGVVQATESKWHDSGDIVSVDNRNFITIKGRAKRFAKIAGEMVSLGAVEMMVRSLWPEANHAAVTLPDSRKGERIVLVTTQSPALKEELLAYSRRFGATELMVPADIINVDEIPVLGTGKIDYATAAKIAGQKAAS